MTALAVDSLLVARRNLAHIRQIPEKLLDVTLQPIMFVLLFAFVFGGVIAVPDGSYREYLIGGILVQTIAFGMMGPGTSLATDLQRGSSTASARCRWPAARTSSATCSPSSPGCSSRSRSSAPPASSSAGGSTPTCRTRSPATG